MATTSAPLSDVVHLARPVVERIVWCTVATADDLDGPRTRLMHPVWWWADDQVHALVTARPTPVKLRQLAHDQRVSCSYWDPAHDTVVIDATARWLEPAEVPDAWSAVRQVPEPVGFDPAMIWPDGPSSPDCRFLRFEARRIVVTTAGRPGLRWSALG